MIGFQSMTGAGPLRDSEGGPLLPLLAWRLRRKLGASQWLVFEHLLMRGNGIAVAETQRQIAEATGVSRRTIIRAVAELRSKQLLLSKEWSLQQRLRLSSYAINWPAVWKLANETSMPAPIASGDEDPSRAPRYI